MPINIIELTQQTVASYLPRIILHPDQHERFLAQVGGQEVGNRLRFWVAEDPSGLVIGQIGMNPDAPNQPATRQRLPYPTPLLGFLEVSDNGYRERGVGRELLRHACEVARLAGNAGVFLTVAKDNWSGRTFFRRYGFADLGITYPRPQYEHNADGSWPDHPPMKNMRAMALGLPSFVGNMAVELPEDLR